MGRHGLQLTIAAVPFTRIEDLNDLNQQLDESAEYDHSAPDETELAGASTAYPSFLPSAAPTAVPTLLPTTLPSAFPTLGPSTARPLTVCRRQPPRASPKPAQTLPNPPTHPHTHPPAHTNYRPPIPMAIPIGGGSSEATTQPCATIRRCRTRVQAVPSLVPTRAPSKTPTSPPTAGPSPSPTEPPSKPTTSGPSSPPTGLPPHSSRRGLGLQSIPCGDEISWRHGFCRVTLGRVGCIVVRAVGLHSHR